ncbi:unnamed protein product [Parascedosporium putredinis]|uniref:NB-ARC domain-containing protein n=1 Tax=Parascedosporium putredinis TaxID=1442378 RepID=A0A9P1GYS3_9PEZI|nr:unnamed protein product [Parascedosporium putredinis]CAI7992119.1 unnamed protein product [Parascedosporium putredinis]
MAPSNTARSDSWAAKASADEMQLKARKARHFEETEAALPLLKIASLPAQLLNVTNVLAYLGRRNPRAPARVKERLVDLVGVIARIIGLADEAQEFETLEERLLPFVWDLRPGRKLTAVHSDKRLALGPTGPNGIAGDVVKLPAGEAGALAKTHAAVPQGVTGMLSSWTYFAEPEGWSVVSDVDDTIKNSGINTTPGAILLREVSWRTVAGLLTALTMATEQYKAERLERIHSWFPKRKMIFVGDSTQSDPEAYGELYRSYPGWVKGILIRKATDISSVVLYHRSPAKTRATEQPQAEKAALFNLNEYQRILGSSRRDPPTTPTVDLILIHGLHGDAIKSWTNPETKAFWPRDFLPLDIPQARVFTFGYDADAVFGSTTANIVDHAKDLLSSLVDEREEEPEITRPIIFIAHSLGGIIAKQALFSASIERQYYCIKESTLGVVFFGTPHRGSDKLEYGKVLADVASKIMNAPRSALLQALKANSHTLLQLTTDFRHQLPQYHVVSFYETKPLRPLKDLIVARESALLNTLIKRIGRITKAQSAIQTSIQPASYNLPFSVPFPKNLDFVGRDVVLKDLQRILFHTPGLQHAAVFGLGGVGKTQVALRIAYWVKDNRPDHSVFWVSALSHAAFEQSYCGIMNEAGLQRDDAEDPKQTVRRHLNSDKAGPWFLIIDNVDDQDIAYTINNYLPHGESGRILFTTRAKTVAISLAGSNYINLLEMSSTESKSFFKSAIHQKELLENESGVDDLLQHLTHLPLAIRQASAYINENEIDPEKRR